MELGIGGDHLTFASVLKQPRSKLLADAGVATGNFLVHPAFRKAQGVNFICSGNVLSFIYNENFSTGLRYTEFKEECCIFLDCQEKFTFSSLGNVRKTLRGFEGVLYWQQKFSTS